MTGPDQPGSSAMAVGDRHRGDSPEESTPPDGVVTRSAATGTRPGCEVATRTRPVAAEVATRTYPVTVTNGDPTPRDDTYRSTNSGETPTINDK